MSTKIFDETELYSAVLAYKCEQDSYFDESENYQKLTSKQQDEFYEDIKKISKDKDVKAAHKALDNFTKEDHSEDSDEEYMEEREDLINDVVEAILNTDLANKYFKED